MLAAADCSPSRMSPSSAVGTPQRSVAIAMLLVIMCTIIATGRVALMQGIAPTTRWSMLSE